MKFSKLSALAATGALVATSVFVLAAPASAADFNVEASDLTTAETNPYSAGWFTGGGSAGTVVDSPSGIVINGRHQILNGTTPTTDLPGLISTADMNVVSGDAAFQIAVYFDHDNDPGTAPGFTTLYKAVTDSSPVSESNATWYATQTYALGALSPTNTIADYLIEFGGPYEILAFGFYVEDTYQATIASVTWAGDTHWFNGAVTATAAPTSVTVSQMADTGVTVSFAGFVPGEDVEVAFSDGSSGGPIGSFVASGTGTGTYTHTATLAPGTYFLLGISDITGALAAAEFTVTADGLAATGADATPIMAGGALLLLVGAGVFLLSRRSQRV